MRPVLTVDVLALARVLAAVPAGDRTGRAHELVAEAEAADARRRLGGTSHPDWGDGTVSSRCLLTQPPPEPDRDDPVHLEAIAVAALVLAKTLRAHRKRMGLV